MKAMRAGSRRRRSPRSEERRVGKECRSRWSPYHLKKKRKNVKKLQRKEVWTSLRNGRNSNRPLGGSKLPAFASACLSIPLFFFQAEDGIRVLYVTGVQTCALPIWPVGSHAALRSTPSGAKRRQGA